MRSDHASAYLVTSENMHTRTPSALARLQDMPPMRRHRGWVLIVRRRGRPGYRFRLLGSRKRKELTRCVLDSLPKWRPPYPSEREVPGRPGAAVVLVREDA